LSFSASIPNRSDFLAISQKQLLANYTAIYNAFLVDHVNLTSNDNFGMHDDLTFRPQSADPVTDSSQSAIYSKIVSNFPQLFFKPDSNQTPIQLTNSNLNTIQTGAPDGTQSSFLAGPFTIYMGFIRSCPSGQLVTLLPATNLLYVGLSTVIITVAQGLFTTAVATDITANEFTVTYGVNALPRGATIYYMAIGQ
jgi:hypothetical protein